MSIQKVSLVKPRATGRRAFVMLVTSVGGLFLGAWFFMLLMGGIHSHYEWVPAIGYWVSFMVALAVRIITPTNPVYWLFEDWEQA